MTNYSTLGKRAGGDVVCIVLFLLLSTVYFLTPLSEGLVLGGHDSTAGVGLGQELREYRARHDGETSRWSNAVFSGMPTYQSAPTYSATSTLDTISQVYGLGTAHWFPAISYVFLYLLGFYILLRAFNFKPYLAALGSILWAFSSYFLIIIAAGHIWKVMTLAFIPPTIGGLVLCYRGKYAWGAAVTALFTAFQVMSNHLQMTYYFLYVMGLMVVAYLVEAIVKKQLKRWAKATAVCAVAGLLGVAANLPNLYHTYSYAKESLRGKSELTPSASNAQAAANATDGLDRDYITAWSYGIDETLTLLIPDFKGGGTASILADDDAPALEGYGDFYECAGQAQQAFQDAGVEGSLPGLNKYWGDQPFTVGPVYVGALVCFLFLLGLFYVKGAVKWALLLATLVSLLFAWGRNIPEFTNFLIDHLPLYSKFRTVSSALVIAEFTLPLLAVLCVYEIGRQPELFDLTQWKGATWRKKVGLPVAAVLTLGLCLLFYIAPGAAGDCLSASDANAFEAMQQAGLPLDFVVRYREAVSSMHHEILSASALRSLGFLVAGIVLLFWYAKAKDYKWLPVTLITLLCLADLWTIDRRYLSDESFTDPVEQQNTFAPTAADTEILKDKGYYRVANLSTGNPFNETSNHTAYFHHSIGGYHAAKLHRYQDLIDHRLMKELQAFIGAVSMAEGNMAAVNADSIAPCLNMLNTKYFILPGGNGSNFLENPSANGNGWFVSALSFVKNADAEIAALDHLDTKRAAVADERFRTQLNGSALDSGTVRLTSYELNELHYDVHSARGGVVVFSEVYYPGWTVTVDGQPAELARVNYILRALRLPAGRHEVVMTFLPSSVTWTNGVAYGAIALIVLLFAFGVWKAVKRA